MSPFGAGSCARTPSQDKCTQSPPSSAGTQPCNLQQAPPTSSLQPPLLFGAVKIEKSSHTSPKCFFYSLTLQQSTQKTSMAECVGISPQQYTSNRFCSGHQLGVPDFSSDTVHLEVASDPRVRPPCPRLPPPQPRWIPGTSAGPPELLTGWLQVGVPMAPFGLMNLLE